MLEKVMEFLFKTHGIFLLVKCKNPELLKDFPVRSLTQPYILHLILCNIPLLPLKIQDTPHVLNTFPWYKVLITRALARTRHACHFDG